MISCYLIFCTFLHFLSLPAPALDPGAGHNCEYVLNYILIDMNCHKTEDNPFCFIYHTFCASTFWELVYIQYTTSRALGDM